MTVSVQMKPLQQFHMVPFVFLVFDKKKRKKKEKKKHVIRSYCTDGGQRLLAYKGANRAAWFLTNKISERLIII